MTLLKSVDKIQGDSIMDVDFERSVRVLAKAAEALHVAAMDEDGMHRLCRALREAKLRFGDVDRWYGTGYNASQLKALTEDIARLLPRSIRSHYGSSVRRHLQEIASRFKRRDRVSNGDPAIYASSVS